MKNNLNFDVSRTPEGIQCIELQEVINRLWEEAKPKAQNKSNTHVQTNSLDKGKGKKPIDSIPSPVFEDEE